MKILKTNTHLLPIIHVGSYSGDICDPYNLISDDEINQDFKEGYVNYDAEMYWDKGFKMDLFWDDVQKVASNYIDSIMPYIKELKLGIKSINIGAVYSPKEYNFETDSLDLGIAVNDNFYKNLVKVINKMSVDKKTELDLYLRKKYTSRDGFISFTANNIEGLIEKIKAEESRETSVFLYWYFKHFDKDTEISYSIVNNNWADYFYENKAFYTEFVSNEFHKECECNDIEVTKYVYEHYMNKDAETIISELTEQINEQTDTWENNELRIERVVKTVNNMFKSIEANTLDLFAK